jgi:hypothetical protein
VKHAYQDIATLPSYTTEKKKKEESNETIKFKQVTTQTINK